MFASRGSSVLDPLLDLVLPVRCLGCRRAGVALCARCAAGPPLRLRLGGRPLVAGTQYAGAVRAALLAYKERGRRDLAAGLAALLVRALAALPGIPAVLVPVPSQPAAVRQRGGDHVRALAVRAGRAVGRRGGGLRVADALVLRRAVRDQSGLSLQQRARNLDGAMAARCPPRPGMSAVVVDDIVTTGATLREAVRALEAAGWRVPAVAVVAATPRRRPGRSPNDQRDCVPDCPQGGPRPADGRVGPGTAHLPPIR